MKKCYWNPPLIRLAIAMCLVTANLCFFVPKATATNDLDDVETDVDSVTSESEAAQNEAADEQKRAQKEKENLAKAKKEAREAEKEATIKGNEAKQTITALDANIRANQKMRKKFEADKAWALRVTAKAQARVKAKQDALAKSNAEVAAAKGEVDAQNKIIADLQKQEKDTADAIAKDNLERDALVKQIAELKQKAAERQAALEKQRDAAHKAADQKEKLKAERDATNRKISSTPNKVITRTPKFNCDVTDQPSDGAAKVGGIKTGTKYDLYRIVNTRWVELQYGDRTAYAAKTCF